MNRTYICDRCPRVAVIVEDDDVLLCSECFLARTVYVLRRKRRAPRIDDETHRQSVC